MRVKEESGNADLKLNIQKTNHGIWSHHFIANRSGKSGSGDRFCFWWGAPESLWMVTAAIKFKGAFSLEEKL